MLRYTQRSGGSSQTGIVPRPWSAFSNNSDPEKPTKPTDRPKTTGTSHRKDSAAPKDSDNNVRGGGRNASSRVRRVGVGKPPNSRPVSSRPGSRPDSRLSITSSKNSRPGSALSDVNHPKPVGAPTFGVRTFPRPIQNNINAHKKQSDAPKKDRWAVTQLNSESDDDSEVELEIGRF